MMRNSGRQLRVTRLSGNAEALNHCAAADGVKRKQIGRPTDYTPQTARAIADQMIDGHTLRAVCQQDGMPDEGTAYRWIASHPEFREMYAHARELQAMRWGEEVLSIADDARLDPQDRRIRVDTRKWLLSKVLPRIYGDEVTVAGDPKAPIHHRVEVCDLSALSDTELNALEAFTDARLVAKDVQDSGE